MNQIFAYLVTQTAVFFVRAGDAHLQRMPVIQTTHTHEILAVDTLVVISYQNLKGLTHGNAHKILNLTERTQPNVEFVHKRPPRLYKSSFIDYNKVQMSIMYMGNC